MQITKANQLLLVALAVALAGGCSTKASGKRIDYESTRTLPTLEIPPDLSSLPPDTQTSTTAGSTSAATYSKFEEEQQRQAAGTQNRKVLPEYEQIKLVRAGAQRWLVIDSSPENLWPQVLDFLDKMGLSIVKQQPDLGVIETNWAENRANVTSGVERFFAKITGQGKGTGLRDKYRVRLERGQQPNTTEIYLTHRGMVQVVDESAGVDLTGRELGGPLKWQPRPPDPELEAEMLRRLMVHLGVNMRQADAVLKEKTRAHARLDRGLGRRPTLTVIDDLDLAWRRVGVTLDSLGFYVENQDRDDRVYFVRDVNEDKKKKKKRRRDEEQDRYRVALKDTAEGVAVEISDIDGSPVRAKESEKILSLLYEQLK
jgi:outer membrane protein assembly factor BamC